MPDQTFSEQWTAKALDTVDTVVATVNDRAVRPVVVAARGVVFGVIIGVIGLLLVVLFCVGLFRLIVVYSPGHHVWAAYLVLGALFCIAGAFLYSRRDTAPSAND